MERLVEDMTHDEPQMRPSSATVMQRFIGIRMRLTDRELRSRIKTNDESWLSSTRRDLHHFLKLRATKKYPAIPSRQ